MDDDKENRPMKQIQRVLVVALFGVLVFSQAVLAQDLESLLQSSQGSMLNAPTETIPLKTPEEGMTAVDVPIDPDTYELGPGDVIGISIPRQVGGFLQVTISPDGSLVVPNMSPITIAGMTITQAQKFISKEWSRGQAGVHIGLLQMRRVRVSIGGAVRMPGQYIATPLDRASVLVDIAGGLIESASLRRATLHHLDGTTENVDLLRYQRSGNLSSNPRLMAGDHLIIHKRALSIPTIDVGGAVVVPGSFPWLEHDRLMDAIELAGGLLWSGQDTVIITRFKNRNQYSNDTVLLSQLSKGDRGPELQPGDVIQVPHPFIFGERAAVHIEGEVHEPGTYPVVAGKTRLSDVIRMAGGFTSEAWLEGARVWKEWRIGDPRLTEGIAIDSMTTPKQRYIDQEILRYYNRSPRKDYLPTNFDKAFNGTSEERSVNDIVLFDSLTITVPRQQTLVLVTGQVNNPGYYPVMDGWNYHDYVKKAGGYGKTAYKSRSRIVPYETGVWLKAKKNIAIHGGDMIFVPEVDEDVGWQANRDIIQILLQTGTLIILILRQVSTK